MQVKCAKPQYVPAVIHLTGEEVEVLVAAVTYLNDERIIDNIQQKRKEDDPVCRGLDLLWELVDEL